MDYKKYLEENGTLKPPVGTTSAAMPSAEAPKSWSDQVADLYGQITNRPAFAYDPDSDPLWQNYKTQYTLAGRRAMEDTMGQAAALTGGYSSSYSQAAGQQQYGDYMTRMSAELPGLYAQARQAYDKEGDDLYNRYNMAMNMEQQEYARDRDELADQRYQEELAYNRQQSERSEARNYATYLLQLGIMPSAEELAAAGMSQQEASQVQNYYKLQIGGYGGGSGGSGRSGGSGGRSGGSGRSGGGSGGSGSGNETWSEGTGNEAGKENTITEEQRSQMLSYAVQYGLDTAIRRFDSLFPANKYPDRAAVWEWIKNAYKARTQGRSAGSTVNRGKNLDAPI